ncbi:5-oxoprolinase subunit PxpB [Arcobacter sp. CECT 8985]|uniref:5-oxoprolinase subunit PxpB n=1 Tax=Arcobacter sp. CECT 8985 TaxID=1935424 RepID=UPI00100B8544|nr:5-oxoprolinase subunit PxpB [Arcobacter sp. CECT 8985]RXJ83611.1 allophanate hydrolase [Arcobacter sp. CECT 8985]
MDIKATSVDSLIIYFGHEIDERTAFNVQNAYHNLLSIKLKGIIEIIPSYCSIFIHYDIFEYNFNNLKQLLLDKLDVTTKINKKSKLIEIDVYYGSEVGFDLENISIKTKLSIEEIISIHSNKVYSVYAIGFLPGFAYLGDVDEKIIVPRLQTPRKIVPKGSIAIANKQTAVYPQDSPGGWNIIGKTTYNFFDRSLDNLSNIDVGNKIKFNCISKEQFLSQGGVL